MVVEERNGGEVAAVFSKSATSGTDVSSTTFPETSPPDTFDTALAPDEPERAVSLVERRACESPDAVSALVDVAGTACGWWLLAELAVAGTAFHGGVTRDGATARERGRGPPPTETSLVESVARATERPTEGVAKTLHTDLLPKLFVSGVVEHADDGEARPERAVVELRSDADREFVSAVLLLIAGAVELTAETGATGEAGYADEALRESVERFATVIRRVRASSRGARRACEGLSTGQ